MCYSWKLMFTHVVRTYNDHQCHINTALIFQTQRRRDTEIFLTRKTQIKIIREADLSDLSDSWRSIIFAIFFR